MENTSFMTIGAAVSSPENWQKCGSWKTQNRAMDIRSAGTKRNPIGDKKRAIELVFVPVAPNLELDMLSAPYYPDWLTKTARTIFGESKEQRNVEQKFGELEDVD